MKTFNTQFGMVEISENRYSNNNALAIQLFSVETGEPIAKLSVNLEESEELAADEFYVKDYSENELIIGDAMASGWFEHVPEKYAVAGHDVVACWRLRKEQGLPIIYEEDDLPQPVTKETTMKTTIIPIYGAPKGWKEDPNYVYIGRKNVKEGLSDTWGNVIIRGQKCMECGEVHSDPGSTLKCYDKMLWLALRNEDFQKQVASLYGKTLVCYCPNPNTCHGSVLAKYATLLVEGKKCEVCGTRISGLLKINMCDSCTRDDYNMGEQQ